MIRCTTCRKAVHLQGMLSMFDGPAARANALCGVATLLGWREKPTGVWTCASCVAVAKNAARVGAAS